MQEPGVKRVRPSKLLKYSLQSQIQIQIQLQHFLRPASAIASDESADYDVEHLRVDRLEP
jgi:hypothetical protein